MYFRTQRATAAYWRDRKIGAMYWRGLLIWVGEPESGPLRKGHLILTRSTALFSATGIHLLTSQLEIHGNDLTTQLGLLLAKGELEFIRQPATFMLFDSLAQGDLEFVRKTATFQFTSGLAKGTLHITGFAASPKFKATLAKGALLLTGKTGTFGLIASGPTVTWIGTFNNVTTGQSVNPHSETVNVGAAGTKIVAVSPHNVRAAAGQRTISSISIDGTNGTIPTTTDGQAGINDGVNEGTQTGWGYRQISTGGNINVTVTYNATHSNSTFDVFTITGHASATHDSAKTATGNNPTTPNLTVVGPGVVLFSASGVEPTTGAFSFSTGTLDHGELCTGTLASMREACGHISNVSSTSTFTVQATSNCGFEVVAAIAFH